MDRADGPFDGALGMEQRESLPADAPDKPDRDVDRITETFKDVSQGDELKVGIAINLDGERTGGTMYPRVVSVEHGAAGFDLRIGMLHDVGDDGWGRIYYTGIGDSGLDPWEVVSAPYHLPSGTADMTDFSAHGWVVGVEIQ